MQKAITCGTMCRMRTFRPLIAATLAAMLLLAACRPMGDEISETTLTVVVRADGQELLSVTVLGSFSKGGEMEVLGETGTAIPIPADAGTEGRLRVSGQAQFLEADDAISVVSLDSSSVCWGIPPEGADFHAVFDFRMMYTQDGRLVAALTSPGTSTWCGSFAELPHP